ncbi:MAG: 2-oxoglutarate dehydrogenase E1 component [Proteobacteria bacterium]|nr:2-oxoglutarate dehydrogenase E1 component [Pseudomonadota bacterium]
MPSPAATSRFSFLSGANADFLAELYERYLQNPSSVDPSWAAFFAELKDEAPTVAAELRGAAWAPLPPHRIIGNGDAASHAHGSKKETPADTKDSLALARQSVRALMLIRAHRAVGHAMADLDPLGLKKSSPMPECEPEFWGFTKDDYDKPIFIDGVLGLQTATLKQILGVCRATYCRTIGYEFLHVQDHDQKQWLQEHIEGQAPNYDRAGKRKILEQLTMAEGFEKFLAVKFPGTKRFGLEGGESTIPCLLTMLERGAELGLEEVVFGMAHRGRLNVLTNILRKSYVAIFAEFQGTYANPESVQGSGDVKYHLGTSCDFEIGGRKLHLTLNANPSHLEYVNPVATGRVRAKVQQRAHKVADLNDDDFTRVAGILLHGDAAFAGQGVVGETMELAQLKGYRTGGTVHVVINNQIGFTTAPEYAKSTLYCTDVAKIITAPIFHVNGDDPEAVAHVSRLAIEFRQKFKQDVVVEIVCYRRHGHNEGDEPAFTQPRMYAKIRSLSTTREQYAKKLNEEGSLPPVETDQIQKDFIARLENDFAASASYKPNKADWLEGKWQGLQVASGEERSGNTGVPMDLLKEVGHAISVVPQSFNLNPKIAKQLEEKMKAIDTGHGIDWATAEALAFGTLVVEGTPVRLSGQDCGRGTFSQRHASLYDQTTEERYQPINHIRWGRQAPFEVYDSPLSETAVLGFEYGYTLAEPNALVMWEAQFGDFMNGAQVIIDQFMASSETKWLRMSGLVLLLPHGHEGQGPEHSSARPERFLQMCAEENWQIANCSTPANYFHILRRQMRRQFRKPLILMTPKSLLRHKMCVSDLSDMAGDSKFYRVIGDNSANLVKDEQIRRVVLCTGKVYYDLLAERDTRGIKDVALVRIEELYPFPHGRLCQQLRRYRPETEVVWCQEEPMNMGAWTYIDRRIEGAMAEMESKSSWPNYVGRVAAAAPATGYLKRHTKEQAEIVDKALK